MNIVTPPRVVDQPARANAGDALADGSWVFVFHQVPAVRHHFQPSVGQRLRVLPGHVDGNDRVLGAVEDEGGGAHLAQQRGQAAAEHVGLPAEPRRHLAAVVPELLEGPPGVVAEGLPEPVLVAEAGHDVLVEVDHHLVQDLALARLVAGCADEHEPADALLAHRRHLGGHEPPEAEPHERRAHEPEPGQGLQEQDGQIARLARPLRPRRLAVARHVGHVHAGPLGEPLVEGNPPGVPRRVVQDDHRRPRPAFQIAEGKARHLDRVLGVALGRRRHARSSRGRLPGPGAPLLYMRAPSRVVGAWVPRQSLAGQPSVDTCWRVRKYMA